MGADKGEFEDGWSGALTRFQTALVEILFDEQLLEGLSFETALAAKITEFAKDDLKRSVSCIFHCVRARHFTNSVIPATATSGYQSWRWKKAKGCRGLSHRNFAGDQPYWYPRSRQIRRDPLEEGLLRKG